MEKKYARRGKPEVNSLDDITQRAREAEIDVASAMKENKMTSSSKDGHRQLHHDDLVSDVKSSRESDSSSHGGDEDDDEDNNNGEEDENDEIQDKFNSPPLAFTGNEGFTRAIKDKDHSSRFSRDLLYRKRQSHGS